MSSLSEGESNLAKNPIDFSYLSWKLIKLEFRYNVIGQDESSKLPLALRNYLHRKLTGFISAEELKNKKTNLQLQARHNYKHVL